MEKTRRMTRSVTQEKRSLSHAFDVIIDAAIVQGRKEKKCCRRFPEKQTSTPRCQKQELEESDLIYSVIEPPPHHHHHPRQEYQITQMITLIEEREMEYYWEIEQEKDIDEFDQALQSLLKESDDEYLDVIKDVLDDIEHERMEYEQDIECDSNRNYWRCCLLAEEEEIHEIEQEYERLQSMTLDEIMREELLTLVPIMIIKNEQIWYLFSSLFSHTHTHITQILSDLSL